MTTPRVWRRVQTLPILARTTDLNAIGRGTLLLGFSFIESTGVASAEVDILDGNDANGALVAAVSLQAGQSTRDTFGTHGVYCQSGPFLHVVSGSIRGALWYVDETAVMLDEIGIEAR